MAEIAAGGLGVPRPPKHGKNAPSITRQIGLRATTARASVAQQSVLGSVGRARVSWSIASVSGLWAAR